MSNNLGFSVQWVALSFFSVILCTSGVAQAGPTSKLVLTDISRNFPVSGVLVVQGDSVLENWNVGFGEWAIAVGDTVRTMGYRQTTVSGYTDGREYLLDGSPTGEIYGKAPSGIDILDGTTDGVYNYGVSVSTVYRFDNSWANGVPLFTVDFSIALGITYDRVSNSLWLLQTQDSTNGTMLAEYSMTGELRSSFRTPYGQTYGLAMDPADRTLWLSPGGSGLAQFSRDGTRLEVMSGFDLFVANGIPDPLIRGVEFSTGPFARDSEFCFNDIDDDGDGLVDSDDPDCTPPPPPPESVGLLVRCIHQPLWPEEGEQVSILAEVIDSEGASVTADRVEIYRVNPQDPPAAVANSDSHQASVTASGRSLLYGCRAERGAESAFSGWREVDVGTPEFTELRAVPVIYNGPIKEKLDIVFIPEANRHSIGAGAWERFQSDIYQVIKEGMYGIPWFVKNQSDINIWLGRDFGIVTPKDPNDSSEKCKKEKPDGFKKGLGFADAAGIIHDRECRDNASFKVFTTRFNPARLQVVAHEIGHAAFSLSDEYQGPTTLYFTLPDFPNLLTGEVPCRNSAERRGKDPDACRLLSDANGTVILGARWIFEPDYRNTSPPTPDLMQQAGSDSCAAGRCVRYNVGPSEIDRMDWKLDKCRAGRC